MAELNIERKQGMGIAAWLIPILLVVGLLWWFFGRERGDATADAGVANTVVAAGDVDVAPIADVGVIVAAPDRRTLVGRRVQLTSVPVQSVPGDESFWVGSSATQRLFVALDPAPGTGMRESPTNVNPGQQVTVAGVVRQVPADLTDLRTRWKLDDATVAALTEGQVYLAADRVAIASPR